MARKTASSKSSTSRSRRAPAGIEHTTVREVASSGGSGDGSGGGKLALRWNVDRDKALLGVLRANRDEPLTPAEVAEALVDNEAFDGVTHLLNAQAVAVRARRLRNAGEDIDVPAMKRTGGYTPSAALLND